MTPAESLVARAQSLGVRLEPNGPKFKVIAPPDLDDYQWTALTEGLAEFKPEVLALLNQDQTEVGADPPVVLPFGPPPWPRPAELAFWPLACRKRWADLTAKYEDEGLTWRDAERRAFQEIKAETRPIRGDLS